MIRELLKNKILILDGAMGTSIQQYGLKEEDYRKERFVDHPIPLSGNHDILSLTQPQIICEIHRAYIDAGADIIETNTFNSNAVSQEDYGCSGLVYELNYEGARLAKSEAENAGRQVFVAGSIGPTSKTLSLSPDVTNPALRAVDFDQLAKTYEEQVQGLVDGGVDVLLVETVFDGLNAKAALYAILQVQEKTGKEVPVMVSATLSSKGGRTLTGQTLEALYTSLSHVPLLSFGLNCSFGATEMYPFVERLSEFLPCYLSVYPNAGLPNLLGGYDETPDMTASFVRKMADEGLVNIVGGCCGTTPEHIRAIRNAVADCNPRQLPITPKKAMSSGLDVLVMDREQVNFLNIGERTNVAGSARFARLIREKKYEEAAFIARQQIEDGARLIDINMDDAMLNSTEEMTIFLRYISNDPEIAKVPFVIDSSDWNTIVAGLKNTQGRPLVNSISLKEGEDDFLKKARELKKLGAMVMVMAFDEEGQAVSYERKIEICQRAYNVLTQKAGFSPEEIVFDVNVLAIGTGIEEHNEYAVAFIRAVEWIKNNLKGCLTSGGISNLSFSFRGNQAVREAMHSVFLYHAIRAGLDMGIVNPSLLQVYDSLDKDLLQNVEDVVLNRNTMATESLLAYIAKHNTTMKETTVQQEEEWRTGTLEERLTNALIKGRTDFLNTDIPEALQKWENPIHIIEGPLMKGMNRIGVLFGEGKMFLPQVVKSARVMHEAVKLLQSAFTESGLNGEKTKRPTIVIATVKGDVHDIGKNIVRMVLECNNFEVIDLGVMVDNHTILSAVKEHHADLIGVSGLITPSLAEMESLCKLLQKEGINIPLIVGGATTSSVHTAVKLAPYYDFGVVHGGDASRTAIIAKQLIEEPQKTLSEICEKQDEVRNNYHKKERIQYPYNELMKYRVQLPEESYIQPEEFGEHNLTVTKLDIRDLLPLIDWTPFFHFWGFKGKYPEIIYANEEAEKLYEEAMDFLGESLLGKNIEASLLARFFDAYSIEDNIILDKQYSLPMLRQQSGSCLSLCDYISPKEGVSTMGLFTLKVEDSTEYEDKKEFKSLLSQSICARLAEAFAEWMHSNLSEGMHMIRPAFGYSACPDHSLKKDVLGILDAKNLIGIEITDSYSMAPATSLCGMLIAHPSAEYIGINAIDKEQFNAYCAKRGWDENQGYAQLGKILI